MTRAHRSFSQPRSLVLTLAACLVASATSGCFVFQPQHDELKAELFELKKKVSARDTKLAETLEKAQIQMTEVEAKLAEAELLLRQNQASLGVRVENVEYDLAELRGTTDDEQNELAALTQNISESRADLDSRLGSLEEKLNQQTNIPEGKTALYKEAERLLGKKDWSEARRLLRTYLSRYPSDAKAADVRFMIGQTLFNERDYRASLGEFYWLVQNAPESPVIHDALYYSGLAFAKLRQCEKAIAYFNAISGDEGADKRYREKAQKQIDTLQQDLDGPKQICPDVAEKPERVPSAESAS